ncbi:MAG: hypothetical protein KDA96_16870 [Planctomycetaceae bacterium]|nr:hypothetical protein [Planctomycetaceae bacterium]
MQAIMLLAASDLSAESPDVEARSVYSVVFLILWLVTSAGFAGFAYFVLNVNKRSFPMINGGVVTVLGPSRKQVPSEETVFYYLSTVLESLDPGRNPALRGVRSVQLPTGAIVRVERPTGEPPSVIELRHYLRVADQMMAIIEAEMPEEKPGRPVTEQEDDILKTFRAGNPADGEKEATVANTA